ncbi:Mu transposase domain-containing protein [Bradyrhizobium japonicum]|uniref:Mu transposase domain-containing protein n=1 Tax=Bradyrhizobium japonicum TaxID=375 RepID=UPI003F73578A
MKPLGGQPSFGSLRELSRVVGNDCAVEIDTNSYSVPWRLIGERVAVTVAAGEVRIRHGMREVAVHKQSQGRRLRIVDCVHLDGIAGRDGLSADRRSRQRRCRGRLHRPRCCVLLPNTKPRSEGASNGAG